MIDIKTWSVVLVSMISLDAIWLGVIQKKYLDGIIQRLNPTETLKNGLTHPLWSFAVVYLLMSLSLTYFVLNDKNKTTMRMYIETILLAAAIYATFDFTMMNLSGGWTLYDALKDISWGLTVFTLSTFIIIKLRSALPHIFRS
jgi:uncharacterized membrane protein